MNIKEIIKNTIAPQQEHLRENWVINKYFQTLKPNKVFKTLLGLIIYHQKSINNFQNMKKQ